MKIRTILAAFGAVLLAGMIMVPSAMAGQRDQLTRFTFNKPVEVPGKVLPAGTYWFKILGQQNDEEINTIYVYNEQFSSLMATVPAIPIQRKHQGYGTAIPSPSMSKIELQIAKPTGSRPAALLMVNWFYPSEFDGHEIVYSAKERSLLSEAATQTIDLPWNSRNNSATYGDN